MVIIFLSGPKAEQANVVSQFAYDFICPILGNLIIPRHPGDGYPAFVFWDGVHQKGINFQGIFSFGSKASDVFGFTSLLLVILALKGSSLRYAK